MLRIALVLLLILVSCNSWSEITKAPSGTFKASDVFVLGPIEIDLVRASLQPDAKREAAAIFESMADQCATETVLACASKGVSVSRESASPDYRIRIRLTRERDAGDESDDGIPTDRIVVTISIESMDGTVIEKVRRSAIEKRRDSAKSIRAFVDAVPTYVARYMSDRVGIRSIDDGDS